MKTFVIVCDVTSVIGKAIHVKPENKKHASNINVFTLLLLNVFIEFNDLDDKFISITIRKINTKLAKHITHIGAIIVPIK